MSVYDAGRDDLEAELRSFDRLLRGAWNEFTKSGASDAYERCYASLVVGLTPENPIRIEHATNLQAKELQEAVWLSRADENGRILVADNSEASCIVEEFTVPIAAAIYLSSVDPEYAWSVERALSKRVSDRSLERRAAPSTASLIDALSGRSENRHVADARPRRDSLAGRNCSQDTNNSRPHKR